MTEISGSELNEDDMQRLREWHQRHRRGFEGFQEDLDLPPNGFRTAGRVVYLAANSIKSIRDLEQESLGLPNS